MPGMAVAYRIDQSTPGTGEADRSRHDLVEGEPIELVAIEPAPGPEVTYQWEIIDRAGTAAVLNATTGAAVTLGASPTRPFAFLIEMRAYVAGSYVGAARRICGARTPIRGLRLPLYSETADPASRLSAPRPEGSTDNAQYPSLAGQGAGPNWRGWVQCLYELVGAVESVEGGEGQSGDALSLRGTPIANDPPAAGEVLTFAGGSWTAAPVPAPTIPSAAGDVTGALGSTTVERLRNRPLASDAPSAGQVLTYDTDNQWRAKTPAATASSVNLSGDVTGTAAAATVARLRGRDVATTAPTSGQVLTWSSGSATWYPATPSFGNQAVGGDATGTVAALTVTALAGHPVSSSAPSAGQVLCWVESQSGAAWTPQAPAGGGNVTGPGGATANALARFNGTSGTLLEGSTVVVDNAGNVILPSGATVDGRDVGLDGAKLDGIEAGAQVTNFTRVQAALGAATADVSLNGHRLTSLLDPLNAQDAVTKAWAVANLSGGGGSIATMAGDVTGTTDASVVEKLRGITLGAIESGTDGQILTLVDSGSGLTIEAQTPSAGGSPAWVLVYGIDLADQPSTSMTTSGSDRYIEITGMQATVTGAGSAALENGLGLVLDPQAGTSTAFDGTTSDALCVAFPAWFGWKGDIAVVIEIAGVRESGGAMGVMQDGEYVGAHMGYFTSGPSDGYGVSYDAAFRSSQIAVQRTKPSVVDTSANAWRLVVGTQQGSSGDRWNAGDGPVQERIGLLALQSGPVELHTVEELPFTNPWTPQPHEWGSPGNGAPIVQADRAGPAFRSYRYRGVGVHAAHQDTGLNRVVITRLQVWCR